MSYTKTNWVDGDIITAEKMNKIEQGIEDASSSTGLKFVKDSEGSYEQEGETIVYTGAVAEGLVGDDIPEEHRNKATGSFSHVEGGEAYFYDNSENNEYYPNIASGTGSHAEGSTTTASGNYSHAEGYNTTASANYSHAEGANTTASSGGSHAEGEGTTASGGSSHAEGYNTTASEMGSHAEGYNTTANADYSHAEGSGTIAKHRSQHVFGEYNIEDPSTNVNNTRGTYIEIVGNGRSSTRSNARTLDWSGNEVLSGKLTTTGITIGSTSITEAQLQSLLALLNN